MSRVFNRRVILIAVALLIAAIVVPPYIYVNQFRPRIAGALSRALGRQVSIGDVSLRIFPSPGLNLSRVVVDDDPTFSQEPLLRADEVTASLRLTSLWRGRLEIANLSFQYPSLNLVPRSRRDRPPPPARRPAFRRSATAGRPPPRCGWVSGAGAACRARDG